MGLPPHTPPSGRPLDRVLPLNPPPGDFGPTPVAPARGEAGGMVCLALLRILIGQRMVVVRLHRIFEYTPCMHARISQFLPVFLLFATASPRIRRHLPARKDVLIDGEAVAETLNAFGLLGANGGDLRQRRYPDRYAGLPVLLPTDTRHCGGALVIHHRKHVSIPTVLKSRVLAIIWANRRPNRVTDSSRRPYRLTRAPLMTLIYPESFS